MYSSKLLFLPFSLKKEKNLFTSPLFIEVFFLMHSLLEHLGVLNR